MRLIGICTSSRSERGLMQALYNEMLPHSELTVYYININDITLRHQYDELPKCDSYIIPSDRSEMARFALYCFHRNIPFCHYLAGSQTHSYCHDDINRWLISLMANFCFAESPEAAENLKRVGIPEDRIMISGTSHFDGITNYDIEANKPKDAPEHHYDMTLYNFTTLCGESLPEIPHFNDTVIKIKPNEDVDAGDFGKEYSHLEFLWLLKHCDHFISNSSATLYEAPYLNKFCGANIKVINPSMRNSIRTSIPPEYCRGASAKIAKWCEEVDLGWLKIPKHFPEFNEGKLLQLPK